MFCLAGRCVCERLCRRDVCNKRACYCAAGQQHSELMLEIHHYQEERWRMEIRPSKTLQCVTPIVLLADTNPLTKLEQRREAFEEVCLHV